MYEELRSSGIFTLAITPMFSLGIKRVGSYLLGANMVKSACSARLFASITSSELRDNVQKLYDVYHLKLKLIMS